MFLSMKNSSNSLNLTMLYFCETQDIRNTDIKEKLSSLQDVVADRNFIQLTIGYLQLQV